jgi:hypothetical protein
VAIFNLVFGQFFFPKHREFEKEYSFSNNLLDKMAKICYKNTIIQYIYKYDPHTKEKINVRV